MNQRVIADPSQHGWVEVDGKWVWDAESGGGAGAGMVISETEPTDKVEGMQWLNPTTGLVLFWDDEKWLQMPTTGAAGKDGKDAVWSEDANGANYTGTVTVNGELLAAKADAGYGALAAGLDAGATSQGESAVAVGLSAGKTNQGAFGVAVGDSAGQTGQSPNTVSVGRLSGNTAQGENAVAIGYVAGKENQGQDSIAIGNRAGQTNQAANGIIINSSGAAVNDSARPNHILLKSKADAHLYYNGIDLWTFLGGTVAAPNITSYGQIIQDGSPVIDAKGLIKTLSTLRNATLDETQDIRESLRSAIDELVEGFEQEIATMPAPQVGTQEISE